MKIFYKYVLPILTLVLTVAAVIIGSVSIAKAYKEPEINIAEAIGLSEFLENEATELYVESNQYARGVYDDKDYLLKVQNSLREVLKANVYEKTDGPKHGDNAYISFTVNNNKYSFSVGQNYKLRVVINKKINYYRTDCSLKIKNIIRTVVDDFVEYYKSIEDYNNGLLENLPIKPLPQTNWAVLKNWKYIIIIKLEAEIIFRLYFIKNKKSAGQTVFTNRFKYE